MGTYNIDRETGDLIPVAGGTLYADNPIGTILPYGGSVAPAGWFICDGSALNRTTYAELFSVIGTSFGVGDGSTTFNIPDMREAVPKGAGLTGKNFGNHVSTNGLSVGEFIDDQVQNHEHIITIVGSSVQRKGYNPAGTGTHIASAPDTGTQYFTPKASTIETGRYGNTTEVKSVGVNYIIKAQRVAVPADFVNSIESTLSDMGIGDTIQNSGSNTSTLNSFFDIITLQVPRGKWIVVCASHINISTTNEIMTDLVGESGLSVYGGNAKNSADSGGNMSVTAIIINSTSSNKTLTVKGYGYTSYTQYADIYGIRVS